MGDPVDVPLEAGADLARLLGEQPPPAVLRQHTIGADDRVFQPLALDPRTTHTDAPPFKKWISWFLL